MKTELEIVRIIDKSERELLPRLIKELTQQVDKKDYDSAMETCMLLIANMGALSGLNQITE